VTDNPVPGIIDTDHESLYKRSAGPGRWSGASAFARAERALPQ